jgi:hypothetical protein
MVFAPFIDIAYPHMELGEYAAFVRYHHLAACLLTMKRNGLKSSEYFIPLSSTLYITPCPP